MKKPIDNLKRIEAAKRADRLQNSRKTGTKTILSKKDKANDPRRQRKTKNWDMSWFLG